MKVIYSNPRAWRVRIAQAAIWLGAVLVVWLAFFAPANPNDQAADKIVAIAGAVFMIAMVVLIEGYLRLYVLRIERTGDTLIVTTLATLHRRTATVDLSATELGAIRRDQAPPGLAPGYDNTWRSLKAKGQPFPFIIDLTASADLEP